MLEPLSNSLVPISAITPTEGLAGSNVVNGTILDTEAYRAGHILILVHLGAIVSGAATSVKVQVDTVSNMATPEDIEGSEQTIADTDDGKFFMIDVINPPQRYLRVVVSRATQNATVSAVYLIYRNKARPVTQAAANVAGTEVHWNKAVGTA